MNEIAAYKINQANIKGMQQQRKGTISQSHTADVTNKYDNGHIIFIQSVHQK